MSSKNKTILIVILVLSILSLGVYSFLNSERHQESQKALAQEKDAVLNDLNKMETQYDVAISENTSLSSELSIQKKAITHFKDSLKKLKNTNWKLITFYKNKIKKLNTTTQNMIRINDSIILVNTLLKTENDSLFVETNDLNKEKDNLSQNLKKQATYNNTLVKQNFNLAKKVAIGEVVKVSNFEVLTFRERGKEKYKETSRARRVDLLKASFLLNENPIAKETAIVAHVVITKPNGQLLSPKGSFNFNEKTLRYTEKSVIPYQKVNLTSEIIIAINDKLEKGSYKIDFYVNEKKVGTKEKVLK